MEIALSLSPPDWMCDDATQKIMQVLNAQSRHALFVGGCVRNMVLGREITDIDIATVLKPEAVIEMLQAHDVKVIPTGIEHGTVTAVIEGRSFEITTLRHDVTTDGRHAEVTFTDSWIEDAKRRDFTMNTLLADGQGNIYDPLGSGVEDAKAGSVVFVGDASKRIAEDYLRILRFFRFYAQYGQDEIDAQGLSACVEHSAQIETLSLERITQEIVKILMSKKVNDATQIMFENNILPSVIDKEFKNVVMNKLVEFQSVYKAVMMEPRLYVVAGCKPRHYNEELRLSNAQQKFLIKLQITQNAQFYADEKALKRATINHGRDLVLQGYLLRQAIRGEEVSADFVDVIKGWDIPKFTLTGNDLMKEGYQTGPELGEELERRKEEWIEEVIGN